MRNEAFYYPVNYCLQVFQNITYKSRMDSATGGGWMFFLKKEELGCVW